MTEAEALVKKNNCSSLRIDFFFSFLSAIDLFCSRKRRSNVYNKYIMNILFLSLVSWDLMVILFFLTNFKKTFLNTYSFNYYNITLHVCLIIFICYMWQSYMNLGFVEMFAPTKIFHFFFLRDSFCNFTLRIQ